MTIEGVDSEKFHFEAVGKVYEERCGELKKGIEGDNEKQQQLLEIGIFFFGGYGY